MDVTMGTVETRFAELIWGNEPITSTQLWRLAEKELGWKKSTTFTVLKRLCDKGVFCNAGGLVTSLISRDAFYSIQSCRFVEETFDGSLPAFLAAFTAGKRLSDQEVLQLRKLIADYEEG